MGKKQLNLSTASAFQPRVFGIASTNLLLVLGMFLKFDIFRPKKSVVALPASNDTWSWGHRQKFGARSYFLGQLRSQNQVSEINHAEFL